ncbi:hypothetical protein GWI72_07220 [Microvirga tunisiensis]|uniref:Polysaccharide pyruvyl transferase domain-containing protein n=1 Tax=Pannonibacter tanglangensis TaxID=2750084 RepID=A0A7X5F3Z4_9HYPH|nr:polysaccharide pyruvyl transferase family protein [Pannonibacter sp. XCT-53]NBN78054.1 hypothetical protein [Pannonibacter sp. XCT-53]
MNIKTQFENVGDALIIRELLRQIVSRSELTVDVSRCPDVFRTSIGVAELPNTSVQSAGFVSIALSMLRDRLRGDTPYYFLIPGGINGEKTLKQYLVGQANTLALSVLSLIGTRVCQTGVSYEALGDRHKRLLRARLKHFHRAMVRDAISLAYAGKHGIRADGIVPDLAFCLAPMTEAGTARNRVAFSFRADKSAATRDLLASRVIDICRHVSPDADLLFVVQVARDAPFMSDLKRQVEATLGRPVGYVECYTDIDACRRLYTSCTHLFSNRLHGLLLALCSGAKPVAVIDPVLDPKIVGVFAQIGRNDLVLDANNMSTDAMVTALQEPFEQHWDEERQQLQRFFDDLYGISATQATAPL